MLSNTAHKLNGLHCQTVSNFKYHCSDSIILYEHNVSNYNVYFLRDWTAHEIFALNLGKSSTYGIFHKIICNSCSYIYSLIVTALKTDTIRPLFLSADCYLLLVYKQHAILMLTQFLSLLHCVVVGKAADVSEVHAGFSFMVEVCKVVSFLCI
jgi:hypothetical protein